MSRLHTARVRLVCRSFIPPVHIFDVSRLAYHVMPTLDYELTTADGRPGWLASWYPHTSDDSMTPVWDKPVKEDQYIDETRCFISTSYPEELTTRWSLKLKGYLKESDVDEEWEFGLISCGRAKVRRAHLTSTRTLNVLPR